MTKIKNLFFLLNTLFFLEDLNAQAFKKGDIIVNPNYGAPNLGAITAKRDYNTYYPSISFGEGAVSSFLYKGTYSLKGEYALNNKIGIGFSIGYWSMDIDQTVTYYTHQMANFGPQHIDRSLFHVSSFGAGIRGNYHYWIKQKTEVFLGFGFTNHVLQVQYFLDSRYPVNTYSNPLYTSPFKSGAGIYLASSLGFRYYPFPFLGLNIEAGYDTGALFLGGIVFKLSTKNKRHTK